MDTTPATETERRPMGSALPDARGVPIHIPSLDGFRGMAVLLVVVFHFLPHAGLGPFGFLISFGWTGVDGFLVLSGFLITGILYKQRGAPRYFQNFYIRRGLRLFPLYYFILLLAFSVSLFAGHPWRLGHVGFLFYAANMSLARDQSLGDLGVFNMRHFWTLALEEQFYLLWPWIVGSRLSRRVLLRICAAGIGIAILCRVGLYAGHGSTWVEYYSLPTRMDSLLIGAVLALIPLPAKALARWTLPASALIFVGLVLAGHNSFFTSPPIILAGYTVLAVFYGSLLVLALHPKTAAKAIFSAGPLRFLGKISYGLYFWHFFFLAQAESLTENIARKVHPPAIASLLTFAVLFTLSVLIAVASYHLIERPFLRLKDRFEPRRSSDEAGRESDARRPEPEQG